MKVVNKILLLIYLFIIHLHTKVLYSSLYSILHLKLIWDNMFLKFWLTIKKG